MSPPVPSRYRWNVQLLRWAGCTTTSTGLSTWGAVRGGRVRR
jgi:hypothetical protein